MKRTKILLVEDDTSLGFLLVDFLGSNDFDVKLCKDGKTAHATYKQGTFDFCILDVMLPDMDGFTLAKLIRADNKTIPIIFLTARSMKTDKLKGFNLGADDYITKPFDEDELLCRINAIINRYNAEPEKQILTDTYAISNYVFDYKNQLLKSGSDSKRLTKKENEILKHLCTSANKIVTRDDILFSVWGDNDYFIGRSLDVFIAKLRKYLSSDPNIQITNIPKVGYILEVKQA